MNYFGIRCCEDTKSSTELFKRYETERGDIIRKLIRRTTEFRLDIAVDPYCRFEMGNLDRESRRHACIRCAQCLALDRLFDLVTGPTFVSPFDRERVVSAACKKFKIIKTTTPVVTIQLANVDQTVYRGLDDSEGQGRAVSFIGCVGSPFVNNLLVSYYLELVGFEGLSKIYTGFVCGRNGYTLCDHWEPLRDQAKPQQAVAAVVSYMAVLEAVDFYAEDFSEDSVVWDPASKTTKFRNFESAGVTIFNQQSRFGTDRKEDPYIRIAGLDVSEAMIADKEYVSRVAASRKTFVIKKLAGLDKTSLSYRLRSLYYDKEAMSVISTYGYLTVLLLNPLTRQYMMDHVVQAMFDPVDVVRVKERLSTVRGGFNVLDLYSQVPLNGDVRQDVARAVSSNSPKTPRKKQK